MNLETVINLRDTLKTRLQNQYSGVPVYTAEVTALMDATGVNVSEFITVFFTAGDETQDGEFIDGEQYKTSCALTVGYFNEAGSTDQSYLDSEAETIRTTVTETPFNGDILRNGWEYQPGVEGSTPGIYFRFNVEYSN